MKFLFPGDRGTFVEYLQLALTRAGHPVNIDGIFGDKTCAALSAFLGSGGNCTVSHEVWQRLRPYLVGYTRHRIEGGDTIASVAAEYGTAEGAIFVANPTVNGANLTVGSELVVPFGFPLVPERVKYSSVLNAYIVEGLLARYPFLAGGSIGKSVMGKEIPYLKIGAGTTQVCYSASYHANESITTPVLLKFAEEYAAAYAAQAELYGAFAPALAARFTLFLIPMVNPDGVDLAGGVLDSGSYYQKARQIAANYPDIPFPDDWKANIEGIDLNLQFPAGWENAKRIKFAQGYDKPAPRDYVGEAPLTAPESEAVYQFTRQNDFSLIIAYHTQGEVIYWKYLDYEPERSREIADYFGEVSGYAVEVTPSESGYAGYKDWFIQDYDRPGYTIEVGLGANPLPMTQFERIYDDNRGILVGGMTELL